MLNSLRRVWRLFLKELTVTVGDRRTRMILVVPPVIQLIMFAYAVSLEVKNVRLGVFNADQGVEAVSLVKSFAVKPVFKSVTYYRSAEELKDAIEDRQIFAGLVFPEDFSQRFLSGTDETASMQLLIDGRRANASAILGGYVAQIVQAYGVRASVERAGYDAGTISSGPVVRRWFNPNLIARNAFMPGLICLMSTTVAVMVSALMISREREFGTFEQLVVSPAAPFEIVVGKATAAIILATVSVMLITGVVIFGFRQRLQGDFWLMFATTLLYLTSIVSIGLMISALSRTQQQSTLGLFLFISPAICLSGFATPIENMPEWLQIVTFVNPVRWEVTVMKGLFLRGTSPGAIGECLIPLGAVAALSFWAAAFMFKRRME